MERLTRFVSNVLNESQRTYKAAQHSSEQDGANKKCSEERKDFNPRLGKQYVEVAEIIAARACHLVEVVGTCKYGKLNI